VRLHPPVFQLPGLRVEHVGQVTECYACGHVTGGGYELRAFVVALCEPEDVSVD